MTRRPPVLAVALAAACAAPPPAPAAPTQETAVKRLTTILLVDRIEPCLPFWTDVLGFTKTDEVPEGDHLGFVILKHGAVELMYQTRESVRADVPALDAWTERGGYGLFLEVADLDALKPGLRGVEVIVPERTTFYGAREIGVRAPCGTPVILAQFGEG